MPTARGLRPSTVAAILFCALAITASAQSASDLGAWDALMVSPFGALPPYVASTSTANHRRTELSLRFGRWEYTDDDAAHDNFGLTLSHELPFANTEIALTAAYLSLQCGECSNWLFGGIDLESAVWRHAFAPFAVRPVTASLRARVSVSGARNSGPEASNARSVALAWPLGIGLAIGSSYLDANVVPGVGFGRIAGPDRLESGALPALGGGVAWRIPSGLGVNLGIQKIFLHRGPSQLGVGLSWGLGTRDRAPP